MKKIKYFKPDFELIKFDNDDVIAASGCERDDICTTVEPIVDLYNYD